MEAAQRRPARAKRKNRVFFPQNDRLHGLKRSTFQDENIRVRGAYGKIPEYSAPKDPQRKRLY